MITVMGASGNTGRVIAKTLLKNGEKVRVLGRSPEKLKDLENEGAHAWVGDITDITHLTAAFTGADAVYTLIPPDPGSQDFRAQQHKVSQAIIHAIKASGVQHVVFLSTIVESTSCPAAGVLAHEARLRALTGTNVLALRACFFFENHFLSLGRIKAKGANGSPIGPDVPISMIASSDIAEVAARALRQRDFKGFVVRELLGERDLTMREVTRILGDRIGKPDLRYVQTSSLDFIEGLLQMGLSQNFAEDVEHAFSGLNENRSRSKEGRGPENTTPTRFETFANVLAHAYQAM
jgi:uncharacterized protein YbjT (DUF2867 family)